MNNSCIHLIHGEEPYLVLEQVETLKAAHPNHTPTVLPEKIDLEELFKLSSSASLFSTNSLILLKNLPALLKAPSDKDINTIKTCCELVKQNQHILIMYCPGKKVDMRKKLAAYLKKNGTVTEHKTLNDWDQEKLYSFIQNYVKKQGKSIDMDAVITLEHVVGNQLSILASSLETLITYVGTKTTITNANTQALFGGQNASFYHLTEALKARKTSQLVHIITTLLDHNEAPVRILASLHNSIRLFYQILYLHAKGNPPNDIGKKLQKHPFFIQKLLQDIKKTYTVAHLENAFQVLQKCDLAIKSGRQAPKKALHLAVMQIQQ